MANPATLIRLTRSATSLLSSRSLIPRSPLPTFSPAPSSSLLLSRSYASKKSAKQGKGNKKQAAKEELDEFEADETEWVGGKGKKGKGKLVSGHGREQEEAVGNHQVSTYELKAFEVQMDESVERMRVGLKTVVGRVGRVSPGEHILASSRAGQLSRSSHSLADLLDKIRVDEGDGQKRPLSEFASVSVSGGKDLLVTVYQESVRHLIPIHHTGCS